MTRPPPPLHLANSFVPFKAHPQGHLPWEAFQRLSARPGPPRCSGSSAVGEGSLSSSAPCGTEAFGSDVPARLPPAEHCWLPWVQWTQGAAPDTISSLEVRTPGLSSVHRRPDPTVAHSVGLRSSPRPPSLSQTLAFSLGAGARAGWYSAPPGAAPPAHAPALPRGRGRGEGPPSACAAPGVAGRV